MLITRPSEGCVSTMRYYATLGPACADPLIIDQMIKAGINGFRVNLSHGHLEDFVPWMDMVRRVAAGRDCELLIDLQGPDLRVGELEAPLSLPEGSVLTLGLGGVYCSELLLDALTPGQKLVFDDGQVVAQVASVSPGCAFCVVQQGGVLQSGKGITAPGLKLDLPTLTLEDHNSLALAKHLGVTGVILPFVRSRDDLDNLRDAMYSCGAGDLRVFAKVESLEGVEHLAQFVDLADEIIIARGDLASEIPLWLIPRFQKQMGEVCLSNGVPYMVVTQLLESMTDHPLPTRAEMSDIYNAVMDGASSLMLTGETAVGLYPAQAAEYLVKAAQPALEDRPKPTI